MTRLQHSWWLAWLVSLLVAALMLGPVLIQPGSVLRGDMVFVPQQPWKPAWLGLDGAVPRAVPMDALVSVVTYLIPGGWLQKLMLLSSFLAGGVGIARLTTALVGESRWATAAAITAFLWNPWVVERLSIGQWATVAGYALLPWVVLATWRLRDDARRSGGLFLLLTLSAVCSPSSGVTAVLVAAGILIWARQRRAWVWWAVSAVLANAPWLVPSLTLSPEFDLHDSAGFAAFHAVGESRLGLVASVMSLGGIWKTSVIPGERTSVVVVAVALLIALTSIVGFLRCSGDRAMKRSLLLVSVVSLLVCVVPAWVPGPVSSWAEVIPGLSIFRDSHRYLPPLALVTSVGLGHVVAAMAVRARPGREGFLVAASSLVVAPLLVLPSAGWGLSGDLRPQTYPDEWADVAAHVAGSQGATIVLPWSGGYRRFGWNRQQASLDPAPRLLPGAVLIDDRIVLTDATLPGEDPRGKRVTRALEGTHADAALRAMGVRWVLVEKPLPATVRVPLGETVLEGRWLSLIDLGEGVVMEQDPRPRGTWRKTLILATDLFVAACFLVILVLQRRRRGYAAPQT